MNEGIVMQCERKNSTHVRLVLTSPGVTIEYGKLAGAAPRFVAVDSEQLSIIENPELGELSDGVGWNVEALALLCYELELGFDFSECSAAELEEAVQQGYLFRYGNRYRLTETSKSWFFSKPLDFDGDATQPIEVQHAQMDSFIGNSL